MGKLYNIFKYKQVTKFLTLVFVLCLNYSWGQTSVPVTRTSWATAPAGWTDSGTGTYLTSFACSGNDGGQLNSTGDYYQIFYSGPASILSFVTKSTSAFTGTFEVQESPNGTTWTTIQSFTSLSTSCVTNNLTLNCTSRYVRFFYTLRNQNISLDDVSILQGTCIVCTPPSITTAPVSQTVCNNTTATFSVVSSATIPTYQWQMSASPTGPFINVNNGTPSGVTYTSGTTSPSLTAIGTGTAQYYYQCLVTENGTCTATSNTVALTVNSSPTITTQPVNKTICSGANTSFTVATSGSPLSYQWQENSGSGFANISNTGVYNGVTTATLILTAPPSSMNSYSYQCIVNSTTGCGTVTSTAAVLTINSSPIIILTPTSQTTCVNNPVTFTISTSAATPSYTWQSSSNNSSWTSISNGSPGGATYTVSGASLDVVSTTSVSVYYYHCIVSDGGLCPTTSVSGTLSISSCISLTNCPMITGVIIDGCIGTPTVCQEGLSEAIFVTNGANPINTTTSANAASNFTIRYGNNSSYGSNATLTDGFVNNNSAITCLNGKPGCSGIFIDALGLTIPAFAKIMLVRSDFCCPTGTGQTDFQNLCNLGLPIYVLFSNDITIQSNGTYKNGPSSTCPNELRYFRLSISGSGCSNFDCYYDACLLTNQSDGDYVTWTTAAGSASYGNNGCSIPYTILPIELLDFYATQNGNNNDVIWKVASEKNVSQYIIEKSEDGMNFTEMSRVIAKAKEGVNITYSCEDNSPYSGITYYRLNTLETNGEINHNKIIYLDRTNQDWKSLIYQQDNFLFLEFKNSIPKNSTVSLFDLSGKLLVDEAIKDSQTIINTQNLAEGMYFIRITNPYKTENFKLIIQK